MSSKKTHKISHPKVENPFRLNLRGVVIEFIGTFFLVLVVGLVVVQEIPSGPTVVAGCLLVIIYMGGYLSEAHYNPAVTLSLLIRFGRQTHKWITMIVYLFVQILAGFAAAWTVFGLTGTGFSFVPKTGDIFKAVMAELLFTFLLCYTIMHVATSKQQAGNSFFGLSIAAVVFVGASVCGPISGGVFNPAVATGPAIVASIIAVDKSHITSVWIYWVGPCAGAFLAGLAFALLGVDEAVEDKSESSSSGDGVGTEYEKLINQDPYTSAELASNT